MVLKLLYIKALLFAIVIFIILSGVLIRRRFALHPYIFLWTLLLTTVGLFSVLRGSLAGMFGATKEGQVYTLWPLVYIVFVAGMANQRILKGLHRVLILVTGCICVYGLIFSLGKMGILPEFKYIELLAFDELQIINVVDGYMRIKFMGINSLPFLIPYVTAISLVTFSTNDWHSTFKSICLWITVILGVILIIMSGRRALLVNILLTPLFIYIFYRLRSTTKKRLGMKANTQLILIMMITIIVCVVSMVYSAKFFDINFHSIYLRVADGFDFSSQTTDLSANIRGNQFFALINEWLKKPFLGAGFGAYAPAYVRSEPTMPWAYELYYVALLLKVGLLGFLTYTASIVWIYWMGIKIIKQESGYFGDIVLANLVGLSCMLFATATNPYLARFDGIWVIFLPIAFINYWLLTSNSKQ